MKPNPIKSGLWSALFTFLASFLPSVLQFTGSILEWADSHGVKEFPQVSVLGYAAVSALMSLFAFVGVSLFRYSQLHGIPGTPPSFPAPNP